jgi:hypothetical protein
MTVSWLPPTLRTIAEVASVEAALEIARRFGGRSVSLPVKLHARHWLVEAVGPSAAEKIHRRFGPGRLEIPLGQFGTFAQLRREHMKRYEELERAGASSATIARELGITDRTVRERRAKQRDRRQGDLF